MSEPERVTARYVGPTDTVGARIVVRWRGRQRSFPFNYGVADTFAWAAGQMTGVPEVNLTRLYRDRWDSTDNRVYQLGA